MPHTYCHISLPSGWPIMLLALIALISFCGIWFRRRFLEMAAITSALVAVMILLLFIISWNWRQGAGLVWPTGPKSGMGIGVASVHGTLDVGIEIDDNDDSLHGVARFNAVRSPHHSDEQVFLDGAFSVTRDWPPVEWTLRALGVQIAHHEVPVLSLHIYALFIPHWLFLLLFCPWFPLLWFRRHRRHRFRVKNGLCLTCGYDLHAHKPGDRCPECSQIIPAPAANPAPRAQTPPA